MKHQTKPNLGNLDDLPDDLLAELKVSKTRVLDDQLLAVFKSYGGIATLDQILVDLYRNFKVIKKRRYMMNKLYRMPMVWSVRGKKGIYTTKKPS